MKTALKAAFFVGTALLWAGCGGKSGTVTPSAEGAAVTQQPLSQTVPIGETAIFTVVATGTAPLSYQWSENGVVIPGATSSSYTTPTVELGNGGATSIGTFQVTVSNSIGSVTSNTVMLSAGPRSPKSGDLRYLLFQQVDLPGLGSTGGEESNFWGGSEITAASAGNAVGTPISMGGPTVLCNANACTWLYSVLSLPSSMIGLTMQYQGGNYSSFLTDLQSYAASNVVFTSLDLEPAQNAYGISWVSTAQPGGFDFRIDPLITPGSDQQAQIQAQAELDGTQSRVITAASFDASGEAILISYGWQGDTRTVYEDQTTIIPATDVVSAATSLASQGYIICAFGGNYSSGYVLVGMRVKGDSLPRPIGNTFNPKQLPYSTPVVYLDTSDVGILEEQ